MTHPPRRRQKMQATLVVGLAALLTAGFTVSTTATAADQPWMNTSLSAEERSDLLIEAMTLEQKMQQIAMKPVANTTIPGCDFSAQGRHVEGIPELSIPTLRMTNGPFGNGDCLVAPESTGLTSALTVASSFDPAVSQAWGDIIGEETRASAHNVLLTPGINLSRVAQAGRNFEYFGEDPYLAGVMAVAQVNAVQDWGVQSVAKHFAANEQETARNTMDTIVDDQTMHELYMIPFEMTIQEANLASVMCSYPHLNGVYACENGQLLNDWLRDDLGFKGYVMSDRGATHTTAAAIKGGLDLEFASPKWFTPTLIEAALTEGSIEVADIDRQLDRRFTVMFDLGQFDDPINSLTTLTSADIERNGTAVREIGEQGSVLLKNENGTLPIDAAALSSVALIGAKTFAGEAKFNSQGPSNAIVVTSPYTVTPEEGLNNALAAAGSLAQVTYNDATDIAAAAALAAGSDVAVVMVGDISREGVDRTSLSLPVTDGVDQDALVAAVVAANPNTVVVLKNGGPVLLPWLEDVPAVLEAWYPAQEDGNIVANLLVGLENPSGKLPITFPTQEREAAFATVEQFPGVDPDGAGPLPITATYSEKLEMGYRWYDANDVQPTFAFGFGLSYTDFELSGLAVTPSTDGTAPIDVTFSVQNTGQVSGAEVGQVYLGLPAEANQPPKRLVGFDKVSLNPGEKKTITVTVDPTASNHPLSVWDTAADDWTTLDGEYTVYVGNSSDNITMQKTLTVDTSVTEPTEEPTQEPTEEPTSVPTTEPTSQPTNPVDPTTEPTDPAGKSLLTGDQLTDANRGEVSVPAVAAQGETITVTVGAVHAGREVSVWLYSDPVLLGTRTVSAAGTVSVTIPASTAPGDHRLVVYTPALDLIGWDDVRVTAPTGTTNPGNGNLAVTGAEWTAAASIAALMILAGGSLVLIRRRRASGES
ncbi:beta-glucosidase [Sanguibacter gelidistatuariae]|uniref:Beta-glucosidase n=1 Tax=Sanguibacter gelidistatuariae TaxID=1814289 RepID=A0A1G6H0A7_9MICO|nr:glycoside hydrolase family 3 C-terminal domain-containing protein [Sanguibacter gelidistatuariae]SDB87631.1 beta-glucosidase [Sanguibacter gelidistatuariae]